MVVVVLVVALPAALVPVVLQAPVPVLVAFSVAAVLLVALAVSLMPFVLLPLVPILVVVVLRFRLAHDPVRGRL